MIFYVPITSHFDLSWSKRKAFSGVVEALEFCREDHHMDFYDIYPFDIENLSLKLNCFDDRVGMYQFYILTSRFGFESYDVPQVTGFLYFDQLEMEVSTF